MGVVTTKRQTNCCDPASDKCTKRKQSRRSGDSCNNNYQKWSRKKDLSSLFRLRSNVARSQCGHNMIIREHELCRRSICRSHRSLEEVYIQTNKSTLNIHVVLPSLERSRNWSSSIDAELVFSPDAALIFNSVLCRIQRILYMASISTCLVNTELVREVVRRKLRQRL
jgi:hypothetical protein